MQENGLRQVDKRFPKLSKNIKAEILVVGGGITGIMCSYFLQKAGYTTVVAEMDEIGSGASGASSGILYYGTGTNLLPAIKLWGRKPAEFMWKETNASNMQLTNFIEKEGLECGLRKLPCIMAAQNPEEAKFLEAEQKELSKLGFSHKLLDESEISKCYSGKNFGSGLIFPNTSQIYPALLAATVAEKFNLPVYENTKIESVKQANDSLIAKSGEAKISCEKIILATNDFPVLPEKPFGMEKFFSQESSVIFCSQKLKQNEIQKFFPMESVLWTMGADYDIVYTHENRLILEVYRMQGYKEKLAAFYPGFNFQPEFQWGSSWGRANDWLPIAGEVEKDIFAAMATSDQGTTVGCTIARNIVDMVKNRKNSFLDLVNPERFLK